MSTDLLLAVLAWQNRFITQDQLLTTLQAWSARPGQPLAQVLVENGTLSRPHHDLLAGLADAYLRQHGGPAETPAARRFHRLGLHAEGGLGRVYRALDQEVRRTVALKEIKEPHADSEPMQHQFLLEAEVTGGLEHPGVVPVYGLGRYPDRRPYYAMRLIQGRSLRDAVRAFHAATTVGTVTADTALALRDLLQRFVTVCQTVAYAHSRGILHRDLKPLNVMLGPFGETLVVDWGLARPLPRPAALGDEGALQLTLPTPPPSPQPEGTPNYMAPEQAAARPDLDERTDIYLLGATLFEILTGRPPHHPLPGENVTTFCRRIAAVPAPRPRELVANLPAALDEITARAMAFDPAERYPSALDVAAAVQRWLADEPVASLREVVAELERLAAEAPERANLREELARNRVNLGLVLFGMNRLAEAETALTAAAGAWQHLAGRDGAPPRYTAELASTWLRLAQVVDRLGQRPLAERLRQQAQEAYTRLVTAYPDDYQQGEVSVILTLHGAPLPRPSGPPEEDDGMPATIPTPPPPAESMAGSTAAPPPPEAEEDPNPTMDTGVYVPPPAPEPPKEELELICRLRRLNRLGTGGLGEVVLAEDPDLKRKLAIKLFRSGPMSEELLRRFRQEMEITAQLHHPNIVPIYFMGWLAGEQVPVMAMRFLDGPTLRQVIQRVHAEGRAAEEVPRLALAFAKICRALGYAHRRGVLHRDPKPSNIQFDAHGEPYLLDWGLARLWRRPDAGTAAQVGGPVDEGDFFSTRENQLLGTPAYMAPEMATGDQARVTTRSDLFILGGVLFEILTGQPPWQPSGLAIQELIHRILHGTPPAPRSLAPWVPPALDAVCVKALARDPADRYATAEEMAQAVERFLAGK